jgi:hypothetical protein
MGKSLSSEDWDFFLKTREFSNHFPMLDFLLKLFGKIFLITNVTNLQISPIKNRIGDASIVLFVINYLDMEGDFCGFCS